MNESGRQAASRATARWTKGVTSAAVFVAAYMAAAAAGAVRTGNFEFVFYLVVMAVLAVCVIALHLRVRLSTTAVWLLAVWGALHMAGGLVPVPADWPIHGETAVLYSWWIIPSESSGSLKFDHVVHAYGFAVATWICWEALRGAAGGVLQPGFGIAVLCALGGLGLGAVNEVVEFAATLLVPATNVGGYVNTGWDLVSNTVGGMGAGAVIVWSGRQGHGR